MKIVEISNLNKFFDSKHILKDFNLEVVEGEIITITGKSGCGKSTLLNIIGLLDAYTSGDMLINGKRITKITSKDAELLRRYYIGYIFQNYALIEKDTVEENLKIAVRYSSEKDKKNAIRQALRIVDLEDYENKKIYELSGGEQQRVAIARAIAHRPKIVFAAEPTAELDTNTGHMVMKIFKDLVEKENITVVMTTHDVGLMELGDVVYQIEAGELVNGTASED